MSDDKRIRTFLELAEQELRASRLLARTNPLQAFYMAAQSAEKIVRAILEKEGIPWGTQHNLGAMGAALPEGHPWKKAVLALDRLSSASTRTRYPTARGDLPKTPEPGQLAQDIDSVAAFASGVKQWLGLGRAAAVDDPKQP
jgi:HEPN domain-containing protein